jgi:hypothetical protein
MIKRLIVMVVPITQNTINLVHTIAANDHMSEGLKIETKNGNIVFDSSCITGVHYVKNMEYGNGDEEREVRNNKFSEDVKMASVLQLLLNSLPSYVLNLLNRNNQ